jgi:uncharacterized protein DUF6636
VRPLLVVAALLVVGAASASAERTLGTIAFFRTPSGNIGCVYSAAAPGSKAGLRCDIRSGIKPRPARPKGCDLDYGDSYEIGRTGRAILVCHGDTALDPRAKALAYGRTWRRNGITCRSKTTGLRCSNAAGHGFFMSRARSYRF